MIKMETKIHLHQMSVGLKSSQGDTREEGEFVTPDLLLQQPIQVVDALKMKENKVQKEVLLLGLGFCGRPGGSLGAEVVLGATLDKEVPVVVRTPGPAFASS